MIRGVVFDIDDTLYLERDYVRSGFDHVARTIGKTDEEARVLSAWLWAAFEDGVRGDTFDRLREAFPEVGQRSSTADLVEAYRTHRPSIDLLPGTVGVLETLGRHGTRLGVLSDGPVRSQAAKADALGLGRWFDPVLLTSASGTAFHKPGTAGFEAIARGWTLSPAELVYVADNPAKDFAGPRALGWLTVRLRHECQLRYALEPVGDADRPEIEVASIEDLPSSLGLDD